MGMCLENHKNIDGGSRRSNSAQYDSYEYLFLEIDAV